MIAQAVLSQFAASGIKTVTFIPAGTPPQRAHQPDMLPARHRLQMVRLAITNHRDFRLSGFELEREGKSFTADSIHLLLEQGLVAAPVPMIIGSDALANLSTWHEPRYLAEQVRFLQAPRPGSSFVEHLTLDGEQLPLNTVPVDMPMLSLSSSWVRERLKTAGPDSLRYFLPDPVRRYIAHNGLYQG